MFSWSKRFPAWPSRSRFPPDSCSAMTELSGSCVAQSFLALLFADDRGREGP
jgi:hypothetical protein